MSQLLELIKQNAVPAAVMRSAARGALSLPPAEMLQILVYLAGHEIFGQQAALTLAGWDQVATLAVLSRSDAPKEVTDYFWQEKNRRPALMLALIESPQVPEQRLVELAPSASRQTLDSMLASLRVKSAPAVLQALVNNPNLAEGEIQQLREKLAVASPDAPDPKSEAAYEAWKQEHAAELAAEEGKAFEMAVLPDDQEDAAGTASPAGAAHEPAIAAAVQKAPAKPAAAAKLSALQKISRMNVAQRVKSAFTGSREERTILICDGAKIVQNAVLASPKLSDPEVEMFAAAKHVSENVLREIARNRRFLKNYSVVRNLVCNPRCPVDISLTLIKNLLVYDLKGLRHSRSIPDILRRVAEKLYKEKMDSRAQQKQKQ